MRIREHKGYGHGLRPGTNEDINCINCKKEKDAGKAPVITGEDTHYHPASLSQVQRRP